ncbi:MULTISPECIES: hypothetical protein [Haloferax]|jgi:hypothetical protein|uniref:Uncharacterized protein n=1 Tax=Haloferax massiliensis TaxID=1476858 RepID=A0A0D6JWP0_9EURY|nr:MULTISPECIES: hypothetical protein [Haloferax]CQR53812.1 hypothetical protein BN996_03809 [Haloferax massiliensis]
MSVDWCRFLDLVHELDGSDDARAHLESVRFTRDYLTEVIR